jgi:DNA polymerase
VLDTALRDAGIDRQRLYVTNAVKHFKNVPRGKRRIHQRPNTYEIDRCRWWLQLELDLIRPRVAVALGATAARALVGRAVAISRMRGRVVPLRDGLEGLVTVHPSYILRLRNEEKEGAYTRFVADLAKLPKLVHEVAAKP